MTDALIGGCLIGTAAVLLFFSTGRIAGISGIAATAMKARARSPWALLFLLGLVGGGLLVHLMMGKAALHELSGSSALALVAGGLLVGVGTRLGSGCTSGHGVCGMARLSPRSAVATATFLGVGMAVATGISWS